MNLDVPWWEYLGGLTVHASNVTEAAQYDGELPSSVWWADGKAHVPLANRTVVRDAGVSISGRPCPMPYALPRTLSVHPCVV